MGKRIRLNRFATLDDVTYIYLRHKGTLQTCIIDTADLPLVQHITWCAWWNPHTRSFYATGRDLAKNTKAKMHRLLCPTTPEAPMVDHRNHNTLDNRRGNLLAASNADNAFNRKGANVSNPSGHRGANFHEGTGKWIARVQFRGIQYHFGYHATPELAGAASAAGRGKLLAGVQVPRRFYKPREPKQSGLGLVAA